MKNSKILLVDDEREILNLLQITLNKEGFFNVDGVDCAVDAIKMCEKYSYDLIVLDIILPDGNGIYVCQRIRELTAAPILFLSAKNSDLDKLTGFAVGADDYITKPFNPLEVVARIKVHLKRQGQATKGSEDTHYCFGNVEIYEHSGEVFVKGIKEECPARELQLLLFLCKHPNYLFSRTQLYEAVWGEACLGADNTVMVHIRRIREKIEEDPSSPKYLLTVRGLGYKLVKE